MTEYRSRGVFSWGLCSVALVASVCVGLVFPSSAEATEGARADADARLMRIEARSLVDPKAVFATVESVNVVPARAQIGGTLADLSVDEGDQVKAGQVIAVIGDEKLALQIEALDAQIAALEAQAEKANQDLSRAEKLFDNRTISKARLEEMRAAADVANNSLKARQADLSVVRQQVDDGAVKAPVDGRVLEVPVLTGTVMMPGEMVARIASDVFILRLRLPERHARYLEVGDEIRLAEDDLVVKDNDPAELNANVGIIRQVYPKIQNGRVVADAEVPNLSSYFVGQRVRVWVDTDVRQGFVVPMQALSEHFGVDTVALKKESGEVVRVPVQRGQARSVEGLEDGVEILSGLHEGDLIVVAEE